MQAELVEFVDAVDRNATSATRERRSSPTPERGRRIRVALVVEAAGGGVAVHIADLIRGLHARGGIEIHLVVPAGTRFDKQILDERVVSLCDFTYQVDMERSVGAHDLRAFAQLFKCLSRIDPDIVHSHSSKAGALARLCFGKWKQVYTPHAVYTLNPYLPAQQRRFYGIVEGLLGRLRSDSIIAVSVDEAHHLQRELRIPAERIVTIFNGVSRHDLLSVREARTALGIPSDAIVVGFVGRFDFQKGVDRLVGVARVFRERGLQNVVFVAIGPGDFASAADIGHSPMPTNLIVTGRLENARRYFSAFDLFLLPSRYEGFPYVVLEAMAAHVPIVATMVSGAGELVEAEEIGFVVPNEDDVTLLSDAVEAIVVDPTMRARMRANCQHAIERFSISTMIDRIVELYTHLLKESK